MTLSILYRGLLSGCNYDCPYCPFAKQRDTRKILSTDALQVERFVEFIAKHKNISFKLFFTPWGEALIRRHYQEAIVKLSHLINVQKVAIQTNLSCSLGWLKKANKETTALWCTYHPGQVSRAAFLGQCKKLDDININYSVGIVGFKETIEEIEIMRGLLPGDRYLWVNALKKQAMYYDSTEKERLVAIDPYVTWNLVHHESKGKACRTGDTVISVDGDGEIFRCHFIKERLGNIYEDNLTELLFPRVCTNATCGCHIGYVHMNDLGLYNVYNGRELERIALNEKIV